jgi:hypothetical protein
MSVVLDLVGTFAFAVVGAVPSELRSALIAGLRKGVDFLGAWFWDWSQVWEVASFVM